MVDCGVSRWLIHPRTNLAACMPLIRRYYTQLGLSVPYFLAQQMVRGRRNPSISSVLSQSSSPGGSPTPSLSPVSSPGLTSAYLPLSACENLTPRPAVLDTTSGRIVSSIRAPDCLASSQSDGSGRYQRFLQWRGAGAPSLPGMPLQSPPRTMASPQYNVQVDQRKIMIQELNFRSTERDLQSLLESKNLRNI